MKKSFLLSIAFIIGSNERLKAIKISLLFFVLCCLSYTSFAAAVVTPFPGGNAICMQSAANGSAPACTTLGTLTVAEGINTDFSIGGDRLVLNAPSGWQFCTASTIVVGFTSAGDIAVTPTFTLTSSTLTINLNVIGATTLDQITISGLQVQALLTTTVPGHIYASTALGIAGISTGTAGTDFGDLALSPGLITGPSSACVGSTITLSDTTAGGTWSSSLPGVGSIDATTGVLTGRATGSTTITYTTPAGCFATTVITVNAPPANITGAHNMCAWYDSMTVHDATLPGTWVSTLVTVVDLGGGNARVYAHAPGIATVSYIGGTGCRATVTFTVNPQPDPIHGDDTICVGETSLLTDAIGGGVWTSADGTIASVGSGTGVVTGVRAGLTRIIYTLPTGCLIDTTFLVNPLPSIITGSHSMCLGLTTVLTDSIAGGTWTSSDATIALISSTTATTATVTGMNFGTATITYTLPTGCFRTFDVTVNPVPSAITGPTSLCQGDSITLIDTSASGTWSSSDNAIATIGSTSGVVHGISGGTVTISYAFTATGCYRTYTVTVNPLPDSIYAYTSFDVCVGSTIRLGDSTAGGTFTGSSGGAFAFVDPVGFVTGASAGVETVTYTLSTGCYVTTNVTVNPLPNPIAGPTSVCVGSDITLTDATVGGTWISSDSLIASVGFTNGIVHGVSAGTVTISYRLMGTGCSVSYDVTVYDVPGPIRGTTTVCRGQTTALSDSIGFGTWSSLDTAIATVGLTTGVVTGVRSGTTVISYVVPGGCFTTANVTVFDLDTITGPRSVCVGSTISAHDTVTGGFFYSSDTAIATIDSVTGLITGISPGVVTISYIITASGCTATETVTVNPLPGITGPTSVCVGSTISLTDSVAATGGGTWVSSDATKATVSSVGVVTGIDTGVVTITYTSPAGCTAFITVTVNPLPPVITGSPILCRLHAEPLSAGSDSTGLWSSSDPTIASVIDTNGTVTGHTVGVVTITYSFSTGCYQIFTLTVVPFSPIVGPNSTCLGSTVTLTDSLSGTWSVDDTTILHIVDTVGGSITVTARDTGNTVIRYAIPGGCEASVVFRVNPLPDSITGPDSVCVGATIVLSSGPTGGTWTSSNVGIATVITDTSGNGQVDGVSAGVVTITYTLPTGCFTTKTVRVLPLPAPIIGPSNVCLGFTITLSDATPGGIWSSVASGIATVTATGTGTTASVFGASVGSTVISYTSPITGCASRHLVNVRPIPIITVSNPSTIICKGASVTLIANGADSAGTYHWSPSTGLSCTLCQATIASPTLTTTYTVTGITVYGCSHDTTTTVVVDTMLNNIRIVGLDSICSGTCDTLRASGNPGAHFEWRPTAGLSCTICDTTVACPDSTRIYVATAIDAMGCKDSVSFKVNVMPLPHLSVSPNPAIVCRGTPTQLFAFGAFSYLWTPGIFLSCDSCSNPVATDTVNAVYIVRGWTAFGCTDSLHVQVSVLDTNVNTFSNDTIICEGQSVQLMATSHSVHGNLDLPTFTWSPSAGLDNPNIANPIATPGSTTTYQLVIRENVCFSDTEHIVVDVEPYPIITLNSVSTDIVAGTAIQLIATVTNTKVKSYLWSPASTVSCDTCFNPTVTPIGNNMTYSVTVTSVFGCSTTDTISFHLHCDGSQVFVPNTFTPNGDGLNDRFFISGKGISLITRFSVFNRWGELLYDVHNIQINDQGAGWDGTYKGEVLPPDVYVYLVEAECELGGKFNYKGDISIVR